MVRTQGDTGRTCKLHTERPFGQPPPLWVWAPTTQRVGHATSAHSFPKRESNPGPSSSEAECHLREDILIISVVAHVKDPKNNVFARYPLSPNILSQLLVLYIEENYCILAKPQTQTFLHSRSQINTDKHFTACAHIAL